MRLSANRQTSRHAHSSHCSENAVKVVVAISSESCRNFGLHLITACLGRAPGNVATLVDATVDRIARWLLLIILRLLFIWIHGANFVRLGWNNNSNKKKSQSNLGRAASPPPKDYPSLSGHVEPHLILPSLDRPHSPPQTASRYNQPFCHSTCDRQTDGHMGLATGLYQELLTLNIQRRG